MFALLYAPGAPGGPDCWPGRPVCCSWRDRESAVRHYYMKNSHLVVFPDFPYKVGESLIDVDTLLSRGLDELAVKVLGEITTLCVTRHQSSCDTALVRNQKHTVHAHLALKLEIALVSNDDHGEGIHIFHSQDLLVESADFLERGAGRDGVDEQEALARAHVLLSHSTINQVIRQLYT